jgi:hypothetical protein
MRLTLVQVLMNSKGYNMNPLQSLYYVSPACFISLLLPFRKWTAGGWLCATAGSMWRVAAAYLCISLAFTAVPADAMRLRAHALVKQLHCVTCCMPFQAAPARRQPADTASS